jgi:16S rRNA (adenine1518-N6/adenine1519-N6)-dimethyltransferase
VATTIVIDLLDHTPEVGRMLVMVQREVADRMVAAPGDASYGLPSVRIARWATARRVGTVGPDVFWPRPRVDSALVELTRSPDAPVLDPADEARLRALCAAGFGQRRKTLRRALAQVAPAEAVVAAIASAGLPSDARAEQLGVDEWCRLTLALGAGS